MKELATKRTHIYIQGTSKHPWLLRLRALLERFLPQFSFVTESECPNLSTVAIALCLDSEGLKLSSYHFPLIVLFDASSVSPPPSQTELSHVHYFQIGKPLNQLVALIVQLATGIESSNFKINNKVNRPTEIVIALSYDLLRLHTFYHETAQALTASNRSLLLLSFMQTPFIPNLPPETGGKNTGDLLLMLELDSSFETLALDAYLVANTRQTMTLRTPFLASDLTSAPPYLLARLLRYCRHQWVGNGATVLVLCYALPAPTLETVFEEADTIYLDRPNSDETQAIAIRTELSKLCQFAKATTYITTFDGVRHDV